MMVMVWNGAEKPAAYLPMLYKIAKNIVTILNVRPHKPHLLISVVLSS